MKILTEIKELIGVLEGKKRKLSGKEMNKLNSISNAYLATEGDKILDYGSMKDFDSNKFQNHEIVSVKGKIVIPAFCDSHTHLVFAKSREQEFADRIDGLTYEEIAARGGGILNSVEKLRDTSEEKLYESALARANEIMKMGTAAVEIKSGYGLNVENEIKMLRVAKKIAKNTLLSVKTTFLGAHAIPKEYKSDRNAYINLIINEMIPKVKDENLAEYIDVFCEKNYFTPLETERILQAGIEVGLIPKVHVNQFNSIGGIEICVKMNALTVDHLEVMTDEDIQILKGSETMPVALPSCSFFLNLDYTPARKLIDEGLALAIASDYNPGSTPSGNMQFLLSLACIKMKLTPQEAINATTINGAYAMNLESTNGSITRGKKASLIVTNQIPNHIFVPYSFGSNNIDKVMINGNWV